MNKRFPLFWILAAIALLTSSCTSSGAFISLSDTRVELSEPNYEIVATGVEGMAEASHIFGVSYSTGITTQSLSLARVSGEPYLYQTALENVWENYRADYGQVEGEKLALANVRYDSDILNLIIYNKVKLSIRADVVRFVD